MELSLLYAAPFSLPGSLPACHPKGWRSGKQAEFASLPSLPIGGGKLASYDTSAGCKDVIRPSLPPDLSLPPCNRWQAHRQAQNRGRLRDGGIA
jgi:hypothetical protein